MISGGLKVKLIRLNLLNTSSKIGWRSLSGHVTWQKLDFFPGPIASTDWWSNGTQIFTASWDRTVKLWDLEKAQAIHTLEGMKQVPYFETYTPVILFKS